MISPTDGDLLRAFHEAGDRGALALLFERHRAMAYRVALGVVGRPADAEDAVQDAFVNLLAYAPRAYAQDAMGGLVARMALRAAQRLARSDSRRRARETLWAPPDEVGGDPVLEGLAARERAQLIQDAVAALSERYRLPVVLHYFQGLSTRETADALGVPQSTVTTRLSRAVGQLRSRLAGRGMVLTLPTLLSLLQPRPADAAPSLAGRLAALASSATPAVPAAPVVGLALGALQAKLASVALVAVLALGGIAAVQSRARAPRPVPGALPVRAGLQTEPACDAPSVWAGLQTEPARGAQAHVPAGPSVRAGLQTEPAPAVRGRAARRAGAVRAGLPTEPSSPAPPAARQSEIPDPKSGIAPGATLRGTVFDAADAPIAGAVVMLTGMGVPARRAVSDARGRYQFDGVPRGTYTLVARKEGMTLQRQVVPVAGPGQVLGVSFRLRPWRQVPWSVAGTVLREDGGTPLQGARVSLVQSRVPGYEQELTEATVDDTGAFGFAGLAPGTYRLRVQADGYLRYSGQEWVVREGADRRQQEVVLEQTPRETVPGTVVVELRDAGGTPLAARDAYVIIEGDARHTELPWGNELRFGGTGTSSSDPDWVHHQVKGAISTNAVGQLQFTMPPGAYVLKVWVEGFMSQDRPVTVPAAKPSRMAPFRMLPGQDRLAKDPMVMQVLREQAVGRGAPPPKTPADAPAQPAPARVAPELLGTIIQPNGTPLRRAAAYVWTAGGRGKEAPTWEDWGSQWPTRAFLVTDGEGHFRLPDRFNLPDGPLLVAAKSAGWSESGAVRVEPAAGGPASVILRLSGPALSARGRVTAPDGRPLQAVRVYAYRDLNRGPDDGIWNGVGRWYTTNENPLAGPWPYDTPRERITPGAVPGLLRHGLYYAETDRDGRFAFSDLDPGVYAFGAETPGFGRATREKVELRTGAAPPEVMLALEPPKVRSAIEGTLTLDDGTLVAYQRVDLVRAKSDSPNSTHSASVRVRGDGRYRVEDVEPGTYVLDLAAPGCLPARRENVVVAAGRDTTGVDFQLSRGLALRGRVLMPDGSPAEGAHVAYRGDGPDGRLEKTVATDGSFELTGLEPGRGTLGAHLPGVVDTAVQMSVAQSPAAPVELRLRSGITVEGTLRDEQGKPIADAYIAWEFAAKSDIPLSQLIERTRWHDHGAYTSRRAYTNAEGYYALNHVLCGPINLHASRQGYRWVRERRDLTGAAGPQVADLRLATQAYGRLRGRAILSDGRPAPGVRLEPIVPDASGERPQATTDAQGAFSLDRVPVGKGTILVFSELRPVFFPEFEVRKDEESVLPDLRVYEMGDVEGTVGVLQNLPKGMSPDLAFTAVPLDPAGRALTPSQAMRLYLPGTAESPAAARAPARAMTPWLESNGGSAVSIYPPGTRQAYPGELSFLTPDKEGRLQGGSIPVGRWRVSAGWRGDNEARVLQSGAEVEVAAGRPARFGVPLQAGESVAGRVLDASGTPIPEAQVHFHRAATWEPTAVAVTGADGRFLLQGLPAGEYLADVWEPGRAAARHVIAVPTREPVTFTLQPGVALRGRITGRRPGRLFISAESDVSFGGGRVADDGSFVVEHLLPGAYRLRAWTPGGERILELPDVQVGGSGGEGVTLDWAE